ncbi:hypothetical protein LPJ63_002091 [Coemansia sp. RSA 2711]|nr:hypothetical protein LPJ63_002091 [Coemansia sp. RSA 2711]
MTTATGRKRAPTGLSAPLPHYDAAESTGNSRPSSPGSAPSTLAESLRSYWESRRGAPRTAANLLRNMHRLGSRAPTRASHATGKPTYIKSSATTNALVSRLVSLIVRDFVQSWYEKISDDQEFLGQVAGQMSQVTGELEKRCRRVDWVRFVLLELPQVVHLHVRDAQQCTARLGTVYVGRETSIEAMFQSMQPHAALTQAADSELMYLRQLANEMLRVFMPTEAQSDEAVHHLLREILACAVLRNVVDALADPSTLNEGIIRAVGRYSKKKYFSKADMSRYVTQPMQIDEAEAAGGDQAPASVETMLREAQTMPIDGQHEACEPANGQRRRSSSLSAGPGRGSAEASAGAEQALAAEPPAAAGIGERLGSQLSFASRWLLSDLFSQTRWRGWKNNTVRGLVYLHLIVTQAFGRIFGMFSEYTFSLNQLWHPESAHEASYRGAIHPVLALVNAVLLLDLYNEWVWVQFVFYIFPLVNALAGAAIDRTLVKVVRFLLSEQQVALYVESLIAALWKPENGGRFGGGGGSRPYKTLEQQRMLRADAEELVAEMLPYMATKFFYGLSEQERALAAQRILEPFENRQLNKHLVYTVLDAIVGKIAPELREPAEPRQSQPASG